MIKFLSELGPLAAFFVGYKQGGIQNATLYMLITAIICLIIYYLVHKKVQKISLISYGILFISAGITLLTGNSVFIKIKPTILYSLFAIAFLVSAIMNRPVIKLLLEGAFLLKGNCWNILSYRFTAFFLSMALANEIVWRNFDEATWVKFKVFGALPITIIFVLLQVPFLLKNKQPK